MPRPKKAGARRRFNGFWLTTSGRDRVVADWIDQQPNAAESIKALIYAAATGATVTYGRYPGTGEETEPPEIDTKDPRVKALAALDT